MKRHIIILTILAILALAALAAALPVAARHICAGDCVSTKEPQPTATPIPTRNLWFPPSPTATEEGFPGESLAPPPTEQPPSDYPAPEPTDAPSDYPEPQPTATPPIIQGPTPTPPNPATD